MICFVFLNWTALKEASDKLILELSFAWAYAEAYWIATQSVDNPHHLSDIP
jgi:hypothetical protein